MTEDTIALVTGGNRGIGFATATLLAARDVTVLIGCRDTGRGRTAAEKLRAQGADAHVVPLDVTDPASARAAADRVQTDYGRLDILINNAGIARGNGTGAPSGTTVDTLRQVFETNVFGVVTVTNAMLPLLRRAAAARIVNVSSEVGSIGWMTNPDGPLWPMASIAYPSSKTALNMVTAMYAVELRDTSIKVNAANPGYCATDLNGRTGFRTPEQGAEVCVHLAALPADGPTGVLWGYRWGHDSDGGYGQLPW